MLAPGRFDKELQWVLTFMLDTEASYILSLSLAKET